MADATRFDDRYYRRFYGEGGAHDPEAIAHLATAVHHFAAWWGIGITSFLDVGAGPGMWRDWYRTNHPEVEVHSLDVSEHACRTWGHEPADITVWTPPRTWDLVVCHSVLQYPDNAGATAAIGNIAAASRLLAYIEVPTIRDFAEVVDERATDMEVHRRSADWYRRRLSPWFIQVGANLWLRRDTVPMYELEVCR
ncbi:MAG: hypothetical protein RL330_277 [Actinomycetota bacterium]|jgi:hypothetical protein